MHNNQDHPEITKLASGFRIVTDYMPQVDSVAVSVCACVGSRFETKENCGIAHFLEHMAFKGTNSRSALDIAREFDEIGGQFNAYTSKEVTVYYAKVLKENFKKALDIISDILLNSVFDPVEIEKERGVVLQEIAQTDDTPDEILFDKYIETAYSEQPFGRPILGSKKLVQSFNQEHLKSFIGENYHSKNILLSVAGNIKHQEVVAAAKILSDSLQKSDDNVRQADPAVYTGGFYQEKRDLEQVHIALGFQGISYHDEDFYAIQILALILGGGMSSRLFQEVREKHGLAYSISAFNTSYSDSGMFSIYSGTEPQQVEKLLGIIAQEIKKIGQDITAEELERAKAQIKSSLLMSRESNVSRAEIAGNSYIRYGEYRSKQYILNKVNEITIDKLQRLMQSILDSNKSNITIAAIGKIDDISIGDKMLEKLYN